MVLLNGLPVMFGASISHLTWLNLIVIVVESFFLANLLKKHPIEFKLRSVIIANVVSAICGVVIAPWVSDDLFGGNFFRERFSTVDDIIPFYIGLTAFILFTILIEGIIYYVFYKKNLSFKKIMYLSLKTNLPTNIAIAACYVLMKYA